MQKYAKIINEETGACIVGLGESESAAEYYATLGMELMEVEQASSGGWYLADKVPEVTVTSEWVNKELFLDALYALVPAEDLAAKLQEPTAFKAGIMGLALLTTNAAPGGMIDLLDERVAEWLAVFSLTLDQVREMMNEQRGETDVQSE